MKNAYASGEQHLTNNERDVPYTTSNFKSKVLSILSYSFHNCNSKQCKESPCSRHLLQQSPIWWLEIILHRSAMIIKLSQKAVNLLMTNVYFYVQIHSCTFRLNSCYFDKTWFEHGESLFISNTGTIGIFIFELNYLICRVFLYSENCLNYYKSEYKRSYISWRLANKLWLFHLIDLF